MALGYGSLTPEAAEVVMARERGNQPVSGTKDESGMLVDEFLQEPLGSDVIEGGVGDPATNSAYRITGKDGRARYQNQDTGRFTKNPLSQDQLAETRAMRNSGNISAGISEDIFNESTSLVIGAQYKDDNIRAGLTLETLAKVGGGVELDKTGFAASGQALAKAEIGYASAAFGNEDVGSVKLNAASSTEGSVQISAKAQKGGPLGVKADIGAKGKLEAVVLQFQSRVQTAEVDVPFTFGILKAQANAEGDFNVGGVGIAGGVGVATLETKPGVRVYVGAGLTPGIGGRGHLGIEVSVDSQRAREVYNNVTNTAGVIYNNTTRVINSTQDYLRQRHEQFTK